MQNNESTNQPVNQSWSQPVNQPIDQVDTQPINPPANQPMNQTTNQPANQPMNQPVGQAIKRWSDLTGIAIVALATGSKVGTLDDFYFDPSANPAANSIRGF